MPAYQLPFQLTHRMIAPVQMPVKTTVEKRERTPEAILSTLRSQPELTLDEVAQAIGRSLRTVERAAAKLKAEDRLRYIGPKKGGRWDVL
ncbi:winged helix-turn-helix transcriptional regulator [Luteimonas sp. MJ250]|uniref:winged helix-turn-helix transcriptional regulator n=1 Tax=Luteimonas sp. MJ250 TaxID=3129236 RepID=UPI0031BAD527